MDYMNQSSTGSQTIGTGGKKKVQIRWNAPVTLGFVFICFGAYLLSLLTGGASNLALFSVYRSDFSLLYLFRLLGHCFGHVSMEHLIGNMTYILLLGPLLEEKYGSAALAEVIFITAVGTGIIYPIFFAHSALIGASGIVFAFILLSSMTSFQDGTIPVTFLLVAFIYLGNQVYQGIFVQDNVSNAGHIIGGVIGSISGFALNKGERRNAEG